MRGTVLYGAKDIRFEEIAEPKILHPTDAIIRLAATCVCGSDLWPYRGIEKTEKPTAMGHEYCGVVEEVGSAVTTVRPGQFVVGSFCISDNTCPHCRFGFQSSCQQREFMTGAQAPRARVPLADGTLVATPELPPDDLIPSLLTTSDVLGTGWYAADVARVRPGSTVVVVGDGAVGLMGVLSAQQMGAERLIAMGRHKMRQDLALEFGATDIIPERGDAGVARIKELTQGIGADSVLECVGTKESMAQAIACARPGAMIGYVGVPHGVELDGQALFFSQTGMLGGPAPVRRFLPHLMDLVLKRENHPGKVFDLTLPLDQVAEGYKAMDERRAIKALLIPEEVLSLPKNARPAISEDAITNAQTEMMAESGLGMPDRRRFLGAGLWLAAASVLGAGDVRAQAQPGGQSAERANLPMQKKYIQRRKLGSLEVSALGLGWPAHGRLLWRRTSRQERNDRPHPHRPRARRRLLRYR